ncbi:hypothetical protein B0H17DRAFT_1143477 [Mycena rosella]|uniref:Uncharacterized protein n=1 Tax=Mycena rosella TaxID=1033263 RepID=A0AAD7CV50_MYCRO|nr:hypothetical protein B0H17DRAFT_1143477 [Mycena rosella]
MSATAKNLLNNYHDMWSDLIRMATPGIPGNGSLMTVQKPETGISPGNLGPGSLHIWLGKRRVMSDAIGNIGPTRPELSSARNDSLHSIAIKPRAKRQILPALPPSSLASTTFDMPLVATALTFESFGDILEAAKIAKRIIDVLRRGGAHMRLHISAYGAPRRPSHNQIEGRVYDCTMSEKNWDGLDLRFNMLDPGSIMLKHTSKRSWNLGRIRIVFLFDGVPWDNAYPFHCPPITSLMILRAYCSRPDAGSRYIDGDYNIVSTDGAIIPRLRLRGELKAGIEFDMSIIQRTHSHPAPRSAIIAATPTQMLLKLLGSIAEQPISILYQTK